MSTITQPVPIPTGVSLPGDAYRFTVDQYELMVRDGTIAEACACRTSRWGCGLEGAYRTETRRKLCTVPTTSRAASPRRLASSS